jgi:C-terminal processing protease CtpA/Prc
LTVFGSRSASQLSAMVSEEAAKLKLELNESDAIGRSDNLSFYNRKVAAVHFFTGMHSDYHRPTDTSDKLNYEGMDRVARLVASLTRRLADAARAPVFTALPSRAPGEEPRLQTYLGSIPDYEGEDHGVKLSGVVPGSPAEAAGLRRGDIITQFAGTRIENLEDLMGQLDSKKPGDQVEIVVRRAELKHSVKATLAARN